MVTIFLGGLVYSMRIVMITDDVNIDRRILLEANSLIEQGEEVVLLAREDPYGDFDRFPAFEVVNKLKIMRIAAVASLHFIQKNAPVYQQSFVNILNVMSVKNQKKINDLAYSIDVKIYVAREKKKNAICFVLQKYKSIRFYHWYEVKLLQCNQ